MKTKIYSLMIGIAVLCVGLLCWYCSPVARQTPKDLAFEFLAKTIHEGDPCSRVEVLFVDRPTDRWRRIGAGLNIKVSDLSGFVSERRTNVIREKGTGRLGAVLYIRGDERATSNGDVEIRCGYSKNGEDAADYIALFQKRYWRWTSRFELQSRS